MNEEMSDYDEAMTLLATKLLDATRETVNKATFDKTVRGKVVSGGTTECDVLIGGKTYSNVRVHGTGCSFAANDSVWVVVPGNDWSQLFILPVSGSGSDEDSLPVSGGTMTGSLIAQSNTQYTTAQVRNIVISNVTPSNAGNGTVWLKYS